MSLVRTRVMVTGGAGFIGSALVRRLLIERAIVTIYDNFLSGDMSNLEEIKQSVDIVRGDILDKNLKNLLKRKRIEYVFNLAAEPYIPHCYYRPQKFFEVNANGALNVLLACRDAKVKRVLQYSTSEVYGTAKYSPMDEDHPTLPLSTYAVSKLAADRLCYTLCHEQRIPVIILRQFNVYGPRETQPYIIPELIAQLSRSNVLKLGNIKARRDFTFVDDAVRGAISLLKQENAIGQVVNSGSGKDYSVEEMAHVIGELMGHKKMEIIINKSRLRPLDVNKLQCDYSRMHNLTGWEPEINFREGIKKTIEHFRQIGEKWIWENKIAKEEQLWSKRYKSKKCEEKA